MVSLTDIAAIRRTAELRGHKLEIRPISADGLVLLIDRFPAIRRMLAERAGDLTVEDVKKLGPEILAAIIAVGIGRPGDEATEAAARTFGLGEQMDVIITILDVTFPKGLAHFVEGVQALGVGNLVGSADTGRAADTKSPSQLNGSYPSDTPQQSPGDTAPDSSQASAS